MGSLSDPAIVVRSGVLGIEPQGLVIVGNGARVVLLGSLSTPAIVVRPGVLGIEPQDFVIVGNGALIIA